MIMTRVQLLAKLAYIQSRVEALNPAFLDENQEPLDDISAKTNELEDIVTDAEGAQGEWEEEDDEEEEENEEDSEDSADDPDEAA